MPFLPHDKSVPFLLHDKSTPFDISPFNFISNLPAPLRLPPHFNLNVASGVAIFMGGKSAVSAFVLWPLCDGQPWHRWYNAPGCHAIAWELVRTLFQTSVSSEYSQGLAVSLGICGKKGPKYIASRSGTVMPQTGYLAGMLVHGTWRREEPVLVGVRKSPSPTKVTIIDLIPMGDDTHRPRSSHNSSITIIPTTTSIAAIIFCACIEDWLAFAMISLGMICSGIVSIILSTGKITLGSQLKPAEGVPPGDGMLLSGTHFVILRGNEKDVNAVTKGKPHLELKGGGYTLLICAFLVSLQVALQLIFMPFASLPGQLVFLLSLLVSGACNLYLSAKEDDVRSNALFALLNTSKVKTYVGNSRATAAALACLALCWESDASPTDILRELVPIKPGPWATWCKDLADNIQRRSTQFDFGNEGVDDEGERAGEVGMVDANEVFVEELTDDAHAAYNQYIQDYVKAITYESTRD